MARNLSVIFAFCALVLFCGVAAFAADDVYQPDFQAAQSLQKALKANDRAAVARLMEFPMRLDYPLPPIKTTGEFLAHWDEFFDKGITAQLLHEAPAEVGWRGVMIGGGLVWFNNGRVFGFNPRTAAYQKRWDDAKKQEAAALYPSLRGYTKVAVICSTKTKHIRIQQYGNDYRYFVWPKGTNMSVKPELELKGDMRPDGNGGDETYTFKNNGFRYEFEKVFICGENCDDMLTVSKGDKEISSLACK